MPLDRCRAEIRLALKAKDLYQIRSGLKNDVFAVLYEIPRKESEGLIKIGATEKLLNTNDPEFLEHFTLVFLFETRQKMKLRFFNAQAENIENENDFPIVGEVDFDLPALFQSKAHGKLSLPLTRDGRPTNGIAQVYGEYIHENRDLLQFHFKAEFSYNPNVLTTPTPFFMISKISSETSDYMKVYQSPAKNKTMTPDWGEINVPMALICNSDFDAPLKIQFFDSDNGRSMGEAVTSVRSILSSVPFDIFLPGEGTKTGKIVNNGSKLDIKPTFTEILGETDIQLVVAFDYSFSNGHPSEPDSLHYLHPDDPKALNPYEQAIISVGNIVLPYDSDQSVPLLGFAARVMKDSIFGPIQHCFHVENHEVHGVKGILESYRKSFDRIRLHGPTLLNLVIDEAGKIARKRADESEGLSYTILLILTDGEMQDKERTIEKIVKHSDAPLSIIIVGVKPEEKDNPIYDDMRVLDGDQQRLQHENRLAVRDIVQFEAFEKDKPATLLAEKVLQEIPEQMISYFELVKKFPKSFIEAMNSK